MIVRFGRYLLDLNTCERITGSAANNYISNESLTVDRDANGKLRAYKEGDARTRVAERRRQFRRFDNAV